MSYYGPSCAGRTREVSSSEEDTKVGRFGCGNRRAPRGAAAQGAGCQDTTLRWLGGFTSSQGSETGEAGPSRGFSAGWVTFRGVPSGPMRGAGQPRGGPRPRVPVGSCWGLCPPRRAWCPETPGGGRFGGKAWARPTTWLQGQPQALALQQRWRRSRGPSSGPADFRTSPHVGSHCWVWFPRSSGIRTCLDKAGAPLCRELCRPPPENQMSSPVGGEPTLSLRIPF